jgi:hypothetical protein
MCKSISRQRCNATTCQRVTNVFRVRITPRLSMIEQPNCQNETHRDYVMRSKIVGGRSARTCLGANGEGNVAQE